MSILERINAFSYQLNQRKVWWWVWPTALVVLAALSITATIIVTPADVGEETLILGNKYGETCGMKAQLGVPCPQCGMTRSWVRFVRGDVVRGFVYNPAGVLLFVWIVIGGLIGALRLITRNAKLLSPPWIALFIWSMFWIFGPFLGLYGARLAGFNTLPECPDRAHCT